MTDRRAPANRALNQVLTDLDATLALSYYR